MWVKEDAAEATDPPRDPLLTALTLAVAGEKGGTIPYRCFCSRWPRSSFLVSCSSLRTNVFLNTEEISKTFFVCSFSFNRTVSPFTSSIRKVAVTLLLLTPVRYCFLQGFSLLLEASPCRGAQIQNMKRSYFMTHLL